MTPSFDRFAITPAVSADASDLGRNHGERTCPRYCPDRRGQQRQLKIRNGRSQEACNEIYTRRGTTSVAISDATRRHSRKSRQMKKRYLIIPLVIISGLCSLAASAQAPRKHPRDFPHHRNSTDASQQLEGTPDEPSHPYLSSGGRPRTDYNSICDEQCNERAWLDGAQRLLEEP
jgi:hypothetical protein